MSELYLVHHGILGQKWGKKNGPPYPLDFKDLSEDEREKAKNISIREGDIRTAQRNRSLYNDQELRDVMTRYELNRRLSELNANTVKKGKKVAMDDLVSVFDKSTKAVQGATKTYESVARLINMLFGTNLPTTSGKKNRKISYKEDDLAKILENIDKYSDEEIKDMTERMKNIRSLHG